MGKRTPTGRSGARREAEGSRSALITWPHSQQSNDMTPTINLNDFMDLENDFIDLKNSCIDLN